MSSRRQFVSGSVAAVAGTLWLPHSGVFAEQLDITAAMTEGPFYPDSLPLDTDNDLIVVNDQVSPAVGEITYLSGRVLSASGGPVANAHVEIWQCDANGIYMHSRDRRHADRDSNFQSYGRFITDRQGRYFFRTIKPVRYTGRTPHIHYAVSKNGHRLLTTQLLVKGEPLNRGDRLFQGVAPEKRETVLAEFQPVASSASLPVTTPQWQAEFNLVLGRTADDRESSGADKG